MSGSAEKKLDIGLVDVIEKSSGEAVPSGRIEDADFSLTVTSVALQAATSLECRPKCSPIREFRT